MMLQELKGHFWNDGVDDDDDVEVPDVETVEIDFDSHHEQ